MLNANLQVIEIGEVASVAGNELPLKHHKPYSSGWKKLHNLVRERSDGDIKRIFMLEDTDKGMAAIRRFAAWAKRRGIEVHGMRVAWPNETPGNTMGFSERTFECKADYTVLEDQHIFHAFRQKTDLTGG